MTAHAQTHGLHKVSVCYALLRRFLENKPQSSTSPANNGSKHTSTGAFVCWPGKFLPTHSTMKRVAPSSPSAVVRSRSRGVSRSCPVSSCFAQCCAQPGQTSASLPCSKPARPVCAQCRSRNCQGAPAASSRPAHTSQSSQVHRTRHALAQCRPERLPQCPFTVQTLKQ